ncbi:MAG TPA: CinA family protein [Kineosporiaceae bacterium]|nr:CinA family protein [Kineosporiaceae bacterium]
MSAPPDTPGTPDADPPAAPLVAALTARGQTLAVAESLTGGALAAAVVDVPGASAVLRGGVVSYATDLKHALLGVDAALLAAEGAVHPEVALQMADGVRERLGATWGMATTGVAGPDPQDGQPPGTVFVAVTGPGARRVERLLLPGGRASVRSATVGRALLLLRVVLGPVQPTA